MSDDNFTTSVVFPLFLFIVIMLCAAGLGLGSAYPAEAPKVTRWQASTYWEPQGLSCGGRFDPKAITVAHRELPCGTKLTLKYYRRSVVATVNDWGPAPWTKRTIDLSAGTAKALKFPGRGTVRVESWPPLPRPRPDFPNSRVVWGEEGADRMWSDLE